MTGRGQNISSLSLKLAFQWRGHNRDEMFIGLIYWPPSVDDYDMANDGDITSNHDFREDRISPRHMALLKLE